MTTANPGQDIHRAMKPVAMPVDQGGLDPTGVLTDLAAFWGGTREQIWQRLQETNSQEILAAEWRQQGPITDEEVRAYYRNTPNYIAGLAKFNMDCQYTRRAHGPAQVRGRVIDFGGGIGTMSLLLAKAGCQVTYLELPSDHRDFAEWRFKRHQLPIAVVGRLDELPSESYDALVGIYVFEHIHPQALPKLVEEMRRVLKPSGRVVEVNDFTHTELHPQHIDDREMWERYLHINRFVRRADTWLRDGRSFAEAQA